MTTLNERNLAQMFIGKNVSESFNELFPKRGDRYVARCLNLKGSFGITDALFEKWEYGGIDFDVILTLSDGVVKNVGVDKCRYGGGHGRPTVHVLKPTQQELRVVRRILESVTT